jgi:uncharacterized protein (DUF1501 family)
MNPIHMNSARRNFLRHAAALGAATGTPFALNLSLIGAAAAQSATDHKALVCVFLNGGMDQSNAIAPYQGTEYNLYYGARPALARSQASLLPISPVGYSGPRLAMASELSGLKALFDQGQCALMANVGLLNQPTTLAQFKAGTARLPAGLYSHSDQSGSWQTGLPDRASATGWLGRVGDLTTAGYNQNLDLSVCVSLAGNNAMQTGASTIQHQLSTQGPILINTINRADYRYNAAQQPVLQRMLTEPRTHLLESAYTEIGARTIASNLRVSQALAASQPVNTAFPASGLASQLRMVARMIAARSALGQRRQIYFVSSGGWDMHDNLVTDHPLRMRELSDAVAAFHAATVELGVSRQVTTFTASEFGRALQSNGRGTDHGWGSHHFVVGGAVAGNRIYGNFPTVAINGPEDAGQGRLLPTTSVDQYAGTLARWFGVPASMLSTVLPNLGRFEATGSAGLGFV